MLAIGREDDIPRPVATATELSISRKIRDDSFGCCGSFQISGLVGESNDGRCVSDVDPLRICASRVKRDAEWMIEASSVGADGSCLTGIGDAAQHQDGTSLRVCYEEIAIGRSVDDAGHHEGSRGRRVRLFLVFGSLHRSGCITASIELDSKACWGDGPRALRPLNKRGTIVYRLRWIRFWQVGNRDYSTDARLLLRVVREGRLPGDRLLSVEHR